MNTTRDRGPVLATAGASLIVLLASIGIDNARAQTPPDAPRELIVSAKDVDLGQLDGIKILYKRIWAAATSVCKPYNGDQAGTKVAWDSCRDATIAYTIARFNVPALQDHYLATTNRRPKATTLASQH